MTEEEDRRLQGLVSFIITHGKWDERVGRKAHWLVRKTWIRYTRFTAQALVRVLMVAYMALSVVALITYDGVPYHTNWVRTIDDVVFVTLILVIVQKLSWIGEGLNHGAPTLATIRKLRGVMQVRMVLVVVSVYACVLAVVPAWHLYQFADAARSFILTLSYYALTVGRPWPPAKKQRVPLRERVPRLLPRLNPVGTRG